MNKCDTKKCTLFMLIYIKRGKSMLLEIRTVIPLCVGCGGRDWEKHKWG